MSNDNIIVASINAFSVQPSRDQLVTLTLGQLQDLVKEAIQPLQDRVSALENIVAHQEEKIASLESTESLQEDNQLIQLRLINDLREAAREGPQPLQRDRGEILRALLAANGGKMLAKDARQKMRMSKQSFTNLLAAIDGIETRPLRTDKRQNLLVLK